MSRPRLKPHRLKERIAFVSRERVTYKSISLATLLFLSAGFAASLFAYAQGTVLSVHVVDQFSNPQFTCSSGGSHTMTNSDGSSCTFTMPVGFCSGTIQFEGSSYQKDFFDATKPPPSTHEFIGRTYDFDFKDPSTGAFMNTLSEPVSIVCGYLEASLGTVDESTLAAYKRGSADTSWSLISNSSVNTASNTVSFSVSSFSSFALLGSSEDSGSDGNGSSGSGSGSTGGGPPSLINIIAQTIQRILDREEPDLPSSPGAECKNKSQFLGRADFNSDEAIDIADLSILLYFADKDSQESSRFDLSDDGTIDLVDISILFYYWGVLESCE